MATCGRDGVNHFLGGLDVHVKHRHLGTFLRHTLTRGPTDAAAASGDDDGFVFHSLHGVLQLNKVGMLD